MTLNIMNEANSMLPNLNKLIINGISNQPTTYNGEIRMHSIRDLSIVALDCDEFPETIFFDGVEALKLVIKPTNEGLGIFSDKWLNFLTNQIDSTLMTLEIFVDIFLEPDLRVIFNSNFPNLKSIGILNLSDMNDVREHFRTL